MYIISKKYTLLLNTIIEKIVHGYHYLH